MIGFMGAHRTGKSTLCDQLVREYSGLYKKNPFSISEIQKRHGFDSKNQSYNWQYRKRIQNVLLTTLRDTLHNASRSSIGTAVLRDVQPNQVFERTPLDLIGYLLLSAPDDLSQEDEQWVSMYIKEAIHLTNTYFTDVFFVQPGIAYVHSDTSAEEDSINKLNEIMLGFFMHPDLKVNRHLIPAEMTDLYERMAFIRSKLNV